MKYLRPFDVALLAILTSLWGVCFVLHTKEVVHGRLARVPLFVSSSENTDGYPTVVGFWPGTHAEASGLIIGDQLVRVGRADLRGVSSIGFTARAYEEETADLRVTVSFVRAGERGEAVLNLDPVIFPWRTVPLILGLAVTGVLVFLRMPSSRPARAFFLCSLAYSINWSLFFGGSRWQTYSWAVMYLLSALVIFPLILRTVLLLPADGAPMSRWALRWPWVFALLGPLSFSWYFGIPLPHEIGMRGFHMLNETFIVILLVLLTRNFRRAGPLGRRQLKWVVYGLYLGAIPVFVAVVTAMLEPRLWWLQEVAMGAMVLTPVCICIAILRFNLFDIDRLISSTAAYSILLILLGAGLLTMAPRLSATMSAAVGIDRTFGQAVLSLFLVLVIVPGQRYLRPQIERLFFVERYALEKGVKQLLAELSTCEGPQAVLTRVGEGLYTLLRPENCVLYGRTETAYVPLLVRGSVVPPTFEVHSPLVSVLQTRATSVDIDRWQRTVRTYLGRSERAALGRLRVAGVLLVRLRESLIAFVCLGQKCSGDVYTATDFSLLTNVAEKVAQELWRCEPAELYRQIEQMQDLLQQPSKSELLVTHRVNSQA